jgi:RNase H-fold protein (predicted Holliday junction resolvase)
MAQSIIGISIGTRSIGIAVIRKGQLLDWQMKSFKGRMNQQKLYMISGAVLKLMREYNSSEVVFKMPDKSQAYTNIALLKKHLTKSLTAHKDSIYFYSLSDIKSSLDVSIRNKQRLLEWGASNYRQLKIVYLKELKNKNSYYIKLFEAVAVLHIHIHRI